jgi:hypothetical protein
MAHKDNLNTSFIKNSDVAHEETDINIRPIVWFMVWLTVSGAVIYLLMAGMYKYLDEQAKKQDAAERSPISDQRNPIPPKPVLQLAPTEAQPNGQLPTHPPEGNNSPMAEVNLLRKDEEWKLKHYTWVDESKGVVSLPIDRAEELALQRGILKSRAPATTPAAPPAAGQNQEGGRLQQDQSGRQQGDEKH